MDTKDLLGQSGETRIDHSLPDFTKLIAALCTSRGQGQHRLRRSISFGAYG